MNFDRTYLKIYEKYVNSIEHVYIDEIGEHPAESDTGNSGYNVIHGKNVKYNGNSVTFETINNKTITKPVIEYIVAVTGSSNQEKRPVVALNITLNGEKINNVPFSISNRETNDRKILLGKEYLRKIVDFVKV